MRSRFGGGLRLSAAGVDAERVVNDDREEIIDEGLARVERIVSDAGLRIERVLDGIENATGVRPGPPSSRLRAADGPFVPSAGCDLPEGCALVFEPAQRAPGLARAGADLLGDGGGGQRPAGGGEESACALGDGAASE